MTADAKALDQLDDLLTRAKAAGAEAADAVLFDSIALSHAQRLGALERLEREESRDIGLRVLLGKQQAFVSSTDTSSAAMDELVTRALAMARSVPEDAYCGLAEPGQLARDIPQIDTYDPEEPAPLMLHSTIIPWSSVSIDVKKGLTLIFLILEPRAPVCRLTSRLSLASTRSIIASSSSLRCSGPSANRYVAERG